jgi:hypothetical protein
MKTGGNAAISAADFKDDSTVHTNGPKKKMVRIEEMT